MKQWMITILTALFLSALTAGCGAEDTVYLEQIESGTPDSTEDREENLEGAEAGLGTEETGQDASGQTGASDSAGTVSGQTGASDGAEPAAEQQTADCYVYVCGAVCSPGVYILEPGSRIYEALAMAGGLAEDASATFVNQAELVWDGQMIYIPTEEEAASGIVPVGEVSQGTAEANASETGDERINLNTASEAELMTLPGIGETKAESILAYRDKNGGFSSVEEIMQVDGIKEGLYNRIKDDIRVN